MEFMASNSYSRGAHRRPWQKSMDSQEFGFASNLKNSMEVAPADELFFKGQLLPLQMDPRLLLVQALSCEPGSRGEPSRISFWCQDEDAIVYNSCGMRHESAPPCKPNKALSVACLACDKSPVDHRPLLEQAPSHDEHGLERELSMFSWCQNKEVLPCRIEGDMGLDNKASTRDCSSQQAPLYDQDSHGPSRLSIWCKDEENRGPSLSNCGKDEEISFSSCRMEGDVDVDYKATMGNMMMDLRSSSFRSHNSGFWESGADKDTGDSSSSSRDSNGSSQDSYFPNNTKLETPYHPHTKPSFNIPWKYLFKKASKMQTSSSSISRKGYSEDLSKYKECSGSSLKEAKEAMLPWKLDCVANDQISQGKGVPSSHDRSKSGFKSKSALCDAAIEDASAYKKTTTSKSFVSKGKGGRDDENEEMKRTQRSAAMKQRLQGYARRLRPLYEMKKGLLGQFRMNECGKRACEVESGNICAARTPMQRRLCHQSSLFESHKLIIQEQNQVSLHPHKGSNMLAMSSCPPSTRSSPNHSGVLADIDPKQKSATTATTLQVAHCTRKTMNPSTNKIGISTTNSSKNAKANSNAFPNSNYTSVSTMQELHSALQSAIAHCKESNKRLDCLA